jgi:hypothetical protein
MIITTPSKERYSELQQALIQSFNIEALDLICIGLGIQIETLKGHNLAHKALSLIEYMDRHRRANELIDTCQRLRPSYGWDAFRQLMPRSPQIAPPDELFSIEIHPEILRQPGSWAFTINDDDIERAISPIKDSGHFETLKISVGQSYQKMVSLGDSAKVKLNVVPKKFPLFGRSKNHTFIIQVGASARQSITGQLASKPLLPFWVVVLISFLSLMVLAGIR